MGGAKLCYRDFAVDSILIGLRPGNVCAGGLWDVGGGIILSPRKGEKHFRWRAGARLGAKEYRKVREPHLDSMIWQGRTIIFSHTARGGTVSKDKNLQRGIANTMRDRYSRDVCDTGHRWEGCCG